MDRRIQSSSDVGLLRRAWARLAGGERVSEVELREAAQIWRGCRSDFAFWLWLSNVASRARHEEQAFNRQCDQWYRNPFGSH